MVKVLLENVAQERRENIKTSKDNFPVVGLEHITPMQIQLTDWSTDKDNTFTKVFKKGDILFGRRRAYLKKAAFAPFDGICSGDITVISPIAEKIEPTLLPFIIQNDDFFDYAVEKSAGSLSPRVKWEHLKNYEFELPSLEEQKKLAKILWAAEETKQAYKKLLQKTDNMINAKFEEMFGTNENKKYNSKPILEVIEKPISGEWGTDDISGNGIKVLRTTNFTDYGTINYEDVITRNIEEKKIKNKLLEDGDIIIEKSGGSDTKPVGRVVYYKDNNELYLVNNFTAILRKKEENINSDYLFYFLYNAYWNGKTRLFENKTTGIHNLKLQEYLSNTNIAIPPLNLQERFSKLFNYTEQSKQQLQKSLDNLNTMMKALINENLK